MNKLTKILLLALTLVLVIGASVAVVASAEDEVLPTIIGKNLVYTDMTAIQIAVDPATVDAKDVKLLATVDGKTATYTSYEVSTDSDVAGAYVFTIKGIPASAISDEVTIVVESGDKASEPFTYSVAEYFYERLYSDGIVNATEGKNAARKEFYETYIANGAAAQELFRNYDKNGNYVGGTTLVTDYTVLAVEKGTFANGKEIILSATDDLTSKVTANAALAADKSFTGKWTVTTYGKTVTTATVANGADATAPAGFVTAVTPVYTDAKGEYYIAKENGTLTSGTIWDFDKDGASVPSGSSAGSCSTISVTDGSLVMDKIDGSESSGESYCRWNATANSSLETPVFIYETDIKIENLSAYTPAKIMLQINSVQTQITVQHSGNEVYLLPASGSGKVTIEEGKWCNLRFELDFTNKTINVFVNNVYAGSFTEISLASYSSSRVMFYFLSAEKTGTVSFDNVYLGFVEDGTAIPQN